MRRTMMIVCVLVFAGALTLGGCRHSPTPWSGEWRGPEGALVVLDRIGLNRCGNRRLNSALHMIALTQMRMHEPARAFMARKQAEGKSGREARRCLKRHIARSVFGILREIDRAGTGQVVQVVFRSQPVLVAASA